MRAAERGCVVSTEPTLNQRLAASGYTTEPAGLYRKRIMLCGACVFEGSAHEVSQWLSTKEAV